MMKAVTMQTVRKFLFLAGFISCLAGACLLFITSYPAITREMRADVPDHSSAVYVGTESCFTCHQDLDFAWSGPLQPRQIDSLVVNPQRTVAGALPIGAAVSSLPLRAHAVDVAYLDDEGWSSTFSASFSIPGSQEVNLP